MLAKSMYETSMLSPWYTSFLSQKVRTKNYTSFFSLDSEGKQKRILARMKRVRFILRGIFSFEKPRDSFS